MLPIASSHNRQSGFTLIEMLVAIVIMGIALTGMLNTMNTLLRHSVDPIIESQGLALTTAISDALAEEDFSKVVSQSWSTLSQKRLPWVDWAKNYKFQCDIEVSSKSFLSVPQSRSKAVTITLKHRQLPKTGLIWKTYLFSESA